MADVVERGDDEVDRHDVDAPALEADRRHPRRQQLAHALDQLEEVVRPVDLVHLAGRASRRRPAPGGTPSTAPSHSLRTIFSLSCLVMKYGWSRPSASSNMSSRNTPSYRPAAAIELTWCRWPASIALANSTTLRVPSMLTAICDFGVGRQVVDRGQVVDVVDLALELLDVVGRHAELLRGEVAVHRDRRARCRLVAPVRRAAPATLPSLSGRSRKWTTAPRARQQGLDEPLADEAGGSGDEIAACRTPSLPCALRAASAILVQTSAPRRAGQTRLARRRSARSALAALAN